MPEIEVGQVTHYFDRIQVAVLQLNQPLSVGDAVRVAGHKTDLTQTVDSLQIDHRPVLEAGPGQEVALKMAGCVREHDKIYKVVPEG